MTTPNSNPNLVPPEGAGFQAQSQMGLPEVLQMCCLSRRSGQITYRSGESYGFIFIQHGNVLHAMCGPLEGADAIYTMLTWPGGGFTLNEDILPHKKTIQLTWEQLLFEGARRADEGTISGAALNNSPVTTLAPAINNRTQESQPKVTITRPDLPPSVYELVHEFTHVGRAPGNEICLPYPSVSSRHCIFIISGADIVLRDLNSSNGTLVNDASINETVLRPGDVLQMGVVQMKFETGIKRPKLKPNVPIGRKATEPLKMVESVVRPLQHETVKLPSLKGGAKPPEDNNNAYFNGQSAINYEDLSKPVVVKTSPVPKIIIGVVLVVVVAIVAYYYFLGK